MSFDLDAVSEAEAPGVSAPTVSSADVVELNPTVDRDGQTARLAAVTVWWLLRGGRSGARDESCAGSGPDAL